MIGHFIPSIRVAAEDVSKLTVVDLKDLPSIAMVEDNLGRRLAVIVPYLDFLELMAVAVALDRELEGLGAGHGIMQELLDFKSKVAEKQQPS